MEVHFVSTVNIRGEKLHFYGYAWTKQKKTNTKIDFLISSECKFFLSRNCAEVLLISFETFGGDFYRHQIWKKKKEVEKANLKFSESMLRKWLSNELWMLVPLSSKKICQSCSSVVCSHVNIWKEFG